MANLLTAAQMATLTDHVGQIVQDALPGLDLARADALQLQTDITNFYITGQTPPNIDAAHLWNIFVKGVVERPASVRAGAAKGSLAAAAGFSGGPFGAGTGMLSRSATLLNYLYALFAQGLDGVTVTQAQDDGISVGTIVDLASYAAWANAQTQIVTVLGGPTGGTFTLSYQGRTTGTLAYNASASTVQAALQGLSSVGVGNMLVSGSAGGPYTVTIAGALLLSGGGAAPGIALLVADGTALTGGTSPSVQVAVQPAILFSPFMARAYWYGYGATTKMVGPSGSMPFSPVFAPGPVNAKQTITVGGSPTGGTYKLTWNKQTTAAIAYNANAAAIQSALEALGAIGSGNVAVTGAGPFTVEFKGVLGGAPWNLITADASGLTGGASPSVTVARLVTGSGDTVTLCHYAITGSGTGTLSNNSASNWPTANGYTSPSPTKDAFDNDVFLGGMPMAQGFAPLAVPASRITKAINGTCSLTATAVNQAGKTGHWTAVLDNAPVGQIVAWTPVVAGDRLNAVPTAFAFTGSATDGVFDAISLPERAV